MVYTEEHEREMVYVSFFVCIEGIALRLPQEYDKIMRNQMDKAAST